ncbi:MAG: hypothetical protein EOP84_24965 [Verrucomicrobiaceae bacterium]|nr:MAG: hypothetical protein EOP84_24965 [Verrucomicrobiaceae bacterium]
MNRLRLPSFACVVGLGLAGCATPPQPLPADTGVSQYAFFPEAYTYSVGDFVLSLPVGYYEFAMARLQFAQNILRDGSPKPVTEQQRYLVLPEYPLAPRREFLVLDQRHLLIFDHKFDLEGGYPQRLSVLRRSDASWSDVSESVLPPWARQPSQVTIEPASGLIRVLSASHPRRASLHWQSGRFTITDSAQ